MGKFHKHKPRSAVKKNKKDIADLKAQVKTSNKSFDSVITSVVTSNATVVNLSNIAQGSDQDNREGNRIRLLSMLIRLSVEVHASATASALRVMIVSDREQNGVDPTSAQLLQTATDFLSPVNRTAFGRFKFLYDKILVTNIGTSNALLTRKISRKLSINTFYDASAAADASNRKGNLYLVAVSNESTNGPTLDAAWRLVFNG